MEFEITFMPTNIGAFLFIITYSLKVEVAKKLKSFNIYDISDPVEVNGKTPNVKESNGGSKQGN
jgi:hypothetical protein